VKEFIIKYWVESLFGVALTLMGWALQRINAQYRKEKTIHDAITNGMKALLRTEIIKTINHYADDKALPFYARENLHDLYDQYRKLGGNGPIKELMEQACEWPTF